MYIPAHLIYENTWNSDYTIVSGSLFKPDTIYEIPLLVEGADIFVFPCIATWNVISPYGWRGSRMHSGTDIKQQLGDTIVAAWDGKVRIARYLHAGYGNVVILRHENGLETLYAHLSKVLVNQDSMVKAGQPIGLAGRTGRATTEHLHFETRFLYKHFNPNVLIDFTKGTLWADTLLVVKNKFGLKKDYLADGQWVGDTANTDASEDDLESAVTAPKSTTSTSKSTSKATYHIVKKGDTLFAISRRYGVNVNVLYKVNHLNENSILQIGQKIKLK